MSSPDEQLHATLLGVLRGYEPDNHLVHCPDTVVVPWPIPPSIPDPAGNGRWQMLTWSVQCGHGKDAMKFETHMQIVKDPEAPEP